MHSPVNSRIPRHKVPMLVRGSGRSSSAEISGMVLTPVWLLGTSVVIRF